MRKRIVLAAVIASSCVVSFFAGRVSAPAKGDATLIFNKQNSTVEFYKSGALSFELEPDDGQIFFELTGMLFDVPVPPAKPRLTNIVLL